MILIVTVLLDCLVVRRNGKVNPPLQLEDVAALRTLKSQRE